MSTTGAITCELHYFLFINHTWFVLCGYHFSIPRTVSTMSIKLFIQIKTSSLFYFKEVQTIFVCAQGLAVVCTHLTSLHTVGACNTELVPQITNDRTILAVSGDVETGTGASSVLFLREILMNFLLQIRIISCIIF